MIMKLALGIFLIGISAQAGQQTGISPVRMAFVHGVIYRQVVDHSDGGEDVIAAPLCKFTSTIPVFDIRSGEDYSSDAVVASCTSEVAGNTVAVELRGKVTLEIWGDKDLKGLGMSLGVLVDPAKKIVLPKPLNGFVGTRELNARSLLLYLDPTGWNGSAGAPLKEETFSASIELDDGV